MPETPNKLRVLHEEFVAAVNEAVAEDRDDLVDELVAEYPEAALQIVAEDEARAA